MRTFRKRRAGLSATAGLSCYYFPAYSWVLAKLRLAVRVSGWLVGKSCLSVCPPSVRAINRRAAPAALWGPAVSWATRGCAHEYKYSVLLRSRSIGRQTRLALPSVCPSLCQSVCPLRAHNAKTEKCGKIRIGVDVPHGTSKWIANFKLKKSKVKVTGSENIHNLTSCSLTGGSAGGRRRLQTRHTPLVGLIHCRRLRRSTAQQLEGRPHIMSALAADMLSCF